MRQVANPSSPQPSPLKGVGFLLARLPVEPPSKAFLLPCERDARAPSTRCAGNAGVPPAIPTTREKTYPFKEGTGVGGFDLLAAFVKSGAAIGITSVAPVFVKYVSAISTRWRVFACNPTPSRTGTLPNSAGARSNLLYAASGW